MNLQNRTVIITGGARGIGNILMEKIVKEGATVGVFDINAEALSTLKNKYPSVFCMECNVADYKQVEDSVNEFYEKYKKIDVLVNNAGIIYNSPLIGIRPEGIKKHDVDMWEKVLKTDLSSVFYMTVNVVEKMISKRTKGVIVNISSVCASGNAGQTAYSAAKAGVNALTATWAKELSLYGIRVVAVAPGYSETESTREAMNEAVLKDIIARVPLRRLGKAEEIADGIIAVIKNDLFNGKIVELDGGLVI